ncbi:hypothetical protein HF576_04815 [Microbacterium sp. CFH 90308]|uniref:Tryptophan-associated transmembrane protein n=1 Tax=Microbacterium salsuginis TaxID=2722803 RepID=A0ABX1K819_9MICO|nr:hypothetical protein [Microbacterium sp. CFH 90308]NLP83159.1 hypothetical protein [Microbacterium sp. CFH 90308]
MPTAVKASSAPAVAAVAAWGAGLVQLALGAGGLTGADGVTGDVAARGAGLLLVTLGAGGIAWGVAALVHARAVLPRFAVAGALAGLGALTALLVAQPARTSVIAVAAASALLIVVALACGLRLRERKKDGADAAPLRVRALIVAAVVVAAVVTPALGTTEAAQLAPDHGTHGVVEPDHH